MAALIRAYASIASELTQAGYTTQEITTIKAEVDHYTRVRDEVKLASGDYIDLKAYEPAMRYLIDAYIRAEDSEKISTFDDLSLIQLIVERGATAAAEKVKGVVKTDGSVAESIDNNVRKLIINESPVDPAYWGSCNPASRRVWFNLELVKKLVPCLEYIVVHELAHLLERHHNHHFTALLDTHLPPWRQYRENAQRVAVGA